ncbi:hypothetical protein C8Q77DRAFT_1152470 [Trametes polyzona]|nr:hypothetical protein C8Q77DRAFT_1152470 [Trametes polyzona]
MSTGPSTTQASGHVFYDSADQPLRVFVEASEVLNRPKVIRILKNNGATISISPEDASIILVDPQTTSGAQFIQEWSAEPGKIVLDVQWVYKSAERGSALLAEDKWGGFAAGPGASGTIQDPLPTPRETPPDAQASQAAHNMQNQPPYPPPQGSQIPMGNPPFGFPYQSQMPQQTQNGLPTGTAIPMGGIATNPNAPVVLPAQLVAQLVGLVTQQGVNPASLGMPQMGPMSMNVMPGQPLPQGFPQQGLPFLSQPGMFVQPQFPPSQQPGMYPPQHMMNPPVLHMQGVEGAGSHHYQSPTPVSPGGGSSISQARRQSSMSVDTFRGSPMDDVRPTSLKRKSPSLDPSSASGSRRTGKARADGDRSTKQRRVSYPSDEAALPHTDSPPPSTQPHRASSDAEVKLFEHEDGEPIKFYVQIDIRPRTKIADAIKKNGGRLVPDIADADYVILGSQMTRTFEERLKQAKSYKKIAVRPQWVYKCVEQDDIVDVDDYVFEGIQIEKRRGRRPASGKRFVLYGPNAPSPSKEKESEFLQYHDEHMAESSDEEAPVKKAKSSTKKKPAPKEPSPKEQTEKETAEKPTSKAKAAAGSSKSQAKGKGAASQSTETAASVSSSKYWRASPPPPMRVVEYVTGRNMYTKDDIDYVDEYLPILFFRDPDMTVHAISEKLHQKMPHHTQKSWQSYISQAARREKYEKIRRQAHIARRKAEASGQVPTEPAEGNTSPPTKEATPTPTQAAAPPPPMVDRFGVLTRFFASGGADNLDDAEVWQTVHRQHPELSAQDWEAYWTAHGQDIVAAVQRLNGVEGSEAPMQLPKPEPE